MRDERDTGWSSFIPPPSPLRGHLADAEFFRRLVSCLSGHPNSPSGGVWEPAKDAPSRWTAGRPRVSLRADLSRGWPRESDGTEERWTRSRSPRRSGRPCARRPAGSLPPPRPRTRTCGPPGSPTCNPFCTGSAAGTGTTRPCWKPKPTSALPRRTRPGCIAGPSEAAARGLPVLSIRLALARVMVDLGEPDAAREALLACREELAFASERHCETWTRLFTACEGQVEASVG